MGVSQRTATAGDAGVDVIGDEMHASHLTASATVRHKAHARLLERTLQIVYLCTLGPLLPLCPLHPAPSEPFNCHLQVEEDFDADLALIGDDPDKPIDLSALKARSKADMPPSQPAEAGGAESTTAQPAAEQSPSPS